MHNIKTQEITDLRFISSEQKFRIVRKGFGDSIQDYWVFGLLHCLVF
jgi:hypothetical protein